MFDLKPISSVSADQLYDEVAQQLTGLLAGERDRIANAANMSALIFTSLPDLNWAGFYFLQGDTLVLGPFQGRPACVRIALGKGVCGTAAAERKTQRVMDVNDFPGHIACDAASRSELVVPLIHQGRVIGVLDLDSPLPGRFTQTDQDGIERLAGIFMAGSSFA
ncbi:MAG: GAF domain-containing protein [Proteobacteria bacterium]|nr:GAF domain-containing protein [Pseudomonadota bacterium]